VLSSIKVMDTVNYISDGGYLFLWGWVRRACEHREGILSFRRRDVGWLPSRRQTLP